MTSPPKPLKQYDSNFAKMLLGLGQFKIDKNYGDLPSGLVAMATENSHRLIMENG